MADDQTNVEESRQKLLEMSDEDLMKVTMAVPWQSFVDEGSPRRGQDEDGFDLYDAVLDKNDLPGTRKLLQEAIWRKAINNPQINTSVRGTMGRLTGWGFETTSEIFDIQENIENIETDDRNCLWEKWPQWVGRFEIEGELFLTLTLHDDGFVEVDFIDPTSLEDGGDDSTGIIFHPTKPSMPLLYIIKTSNGDEIQIPSIFVARYPELIALVRKNKDFKITKQEGSRSRSKVYKKFGGYKRFMISMSKGFATKRAVSHLRTTLKWINYYENLKMYEIDHKKAAGAYVWKFTIEDPKSFKQWLALSDEDRRKTAPFQKKTPGSTLVMPPGMNVEVVSVNLPSLSGQDTDVMEMVTSGTNEPNDIATGTQKGTYASTKASRGPFSDRTSDEMAYFQRWLVNRFWKSVFFLQSSINKFPSEFPVEEVVSFSSNGKEVMKKVKKSPEKLVDITFPTSEMIDYEGRAKGLLGVKHGPLSESLGISNKTIASKIGIGGYGRERLRKATEDKKYPELVYAEGVDAESMQEKTEGEKPKNGGEK